MPTEPFRFVHAASLLLDHPLEQTGPVPESWQDVVRHASRGAFERIIDTCLVQNVDALFLVGDSFCAADIGISGQTRLVRGLDRLAERDIPVFIVPGERDPWSAWLPGLRFGDHVCRLGYDCDAAVPLSRDDRRLAMIYGVRGNFTTGRNGFDLPRIEQLHVSELDQDAPLSIALLAGELPESPPARMTYWALGGSGIRSTRSLGGSLAHHPGSPQGVHGQARGPHGCSLVEIDEAGAIHTQFISTAPVRYEQLETQLSSTASWANMQQALINELQKIDQHQGDRFWFLDWKCSEMPSVEGRELTRQEQEELFGELAPLAGLTEIGLVLGKVTTTLTPSLTSDADPLAREFVDHLQQRFASGSCSSRQCLQQSNLQESVWERRLETVERNEESDLAAAAQRWGLRWLAGQEGTASS